MYISTVHCSNLVIRVLWRTWFSLAAFTDVFGFVYRIKFLYHAILVLWKNHYKFL